MRLWYFLAEKRSRHFTVFEKWESKSENKLVVIWKEYIDENPNVKNLAVRIDSKYIYNPFKIPSILKSFYIFGYTNDQIR